MTARTEAIWSRIPEAERELIRTAPPGQRDRWIELWALAEENERRRAIVAEDREAAADALDEALLDRVTRGEYGAPAMRALAECANRWPLGESRRGFLRAARRAIREARTRAGRKAEA